MKLSKAQLTQVKDFVSSRGFAYYDVQLEIIDHVACKVEELMTTNPELSLDVAIAQTHAGFGVMGFSVVEDSMAAALQKKYWRLFRHTFASYLSWKYLPLIAGFIYLCYKVSIAVNAPANLINVSWGFVLAALTVYCVLNYKRQQRYKKMLTAQMGNMVIIVANIPLQVFNMTNIFTRHVTNAGITGIVLGVFIAVTIIGILTLQYMQNTAVEQCRELEAQYHLTVGG